MTKSRLDVLLVEKGLVDSRNKAQSLIMMGKVRAGDQVLTKVGSQIPADTELTIDYGLPYVSRGGLKLEAALDAFAITPSEAVCADVGASTGGFTDVWLQRGAKRIYAIDVGYGQLAWKLRQDERVIVMERRNARYVDSLPETIDFASIDTSFISLRLILPAVIKWLAPTAAIIALIKPQFEADRHQVGKKGLIREPAIHRHVLEKVILGAEELGLITLGLIASPITGTTGNQEFLVYWGWHTDLSPIQIPQAIERCLTAS